MDQIFSEYASLQNQIAALELKKEQLKPFILEGLQQREDGKLDIGSGKFSITRRKTWKYPEYVTKLKDDFDEAKAKAESTGEATFTETEGFMFKPVDL